MKVNLTFVFALAVASALSAQVPARVILGGKAVVMVADAVYAFPGIRSRVIAVAGTDQGLGTFLNLVDPGFLSKPPLDRQAGVESFAALKPDIVLLKSMMAQSLGAQLGALGLKTLYLQLETPEDYYRDLGALGDAFGETARAKDLSSWFEGKETAVTLKAGAIPKGDRKRVLLVKASYAKGESFEIPPVSYMQTLLVERAGGIPVWKDSNSSQGWAKVSFEQVAAWNPDVIVVASYGEDSGAIAGSMLADPRFQALKAGTAKAIYGMPQDWYSWDQPDTRWILGFRWMAKTVYPRSFSEISVLDDAREFYQKLYGIGKPAFDSKVLPLLKGDYGL